MGLFSKGGFFDKALRSFDKAVVQPVIKPVLSIAGSIAPLIPAVGPLVSLGINTVSQLLPESAQKAMVDAVNRDGIIKADEVVKTLAQYNPNMSPDDLAAATLGIVEGLQGSKKTSTSTVTDANSPIKIPFMDKLMGYVKTYWYVCVGVVGFGVYWFFIRKGKKRRRY